MKSLLKNDIYLLLILLLSTINSCTDKETINEDKNKYISNGYFTATIIGQSSFLFSAQTITVHTSSDIMFKGRINNSNEYIEIHIPLSATTSNSFTLTTGASLVYYNYQGSAYSASNCSGNINIYVSDKTNKYIEGTFSGKVSNSSCEGYSISSGEFQVYY